MENFHPVSCSAVWDRQCKFSESRGFLSQPCLHQSNLHMKSGLPFAEVPCLHQSNLHMKRKLREWRTQKCNPCFGAESPPRSTPRTALSHLAVQSNLHMPVNHPVSCSAVLDRECKFSESRGFLSPSYRVCTNPHMKRKLHKNAMKSPPRIQFSESRGFLSPRYLCLHQSNAILHMKRKLREWRTQKCNPCFGAESPPRSTGQ